LNPLHLTSLHMHVSSLSLNFLIISLSPLFFTGEAW